MKKAVFYHAGCMDGTGAAAAHYFQVERRMRADPELDLRLELPELEYEYVSINYGTNTTDKFNALLEDNLDFKPRVMYFLDFTPTREILIDLLESGKKVIIVDHHKTGIDAIQSLPDNLRYGENFAYVLSSTNDFSGASLTQTVGYQLESILDRPGTNEDIVMHTIFEKHFITNRLFSEPLATVSRLYQLIEVRDCWKTDHPTISKQMADNFNAFARHNKLSNINHFVDFQRQLKRATALTSTPGNDDILIDKVCEEGKLISSIREELAKSFIHQGFIAEVNDIRVIIANVPGALSSEFGEAWNSLEPDKKSIAIAVTYDHKLEVAILSIRSRNVNSRLLAQAIHPNGGGHDNACGCNLDVLEIPFTPAVKFSQVPELLNAKLINMIKLVY